MADCRADDWPRVRPGLLVVVLNWNSCESVCELLEELGPFGHGRVLVLDNGSASVDSERDTITQGFPAVLWAETGTNGGYGFGMNHAVELAAQLCSDRVILLNADSRPSVSQLLAIAAELDVAEIVGIRQSTTGTETGEYATAGTPRGIVFAEFRCTGCSAGSHEVGCVSGAAMGVRVDPFIKLGGFDTQYFHYREEVDLCLRADREGLRLRWICSSVVKHMRGGSLPSDSASATYYRCRNEFLYFRANGGPLWPIHWRLWATVAAHALRATRAGQLTAACSGALDGIRGVQGQLTTPLGT